MNPALWQIDFKENLPGKQKERPGRIHEGDKTRLSYVISLAPYNRLLYWTYQNKYPQSTMRT